MNKKIQEIQKRFDAVNTLEASREDVHTFYNHAQDDVSFLLNEVEQMTSILDEIRDLARTNLKPDIFNYTDLEWSTHRLNRCALLADRILEI